MLALSFGVITWTFGISVNKIKLSSQLSSGAVKLANF